MTSTDDRTAHGRSRPAQMPADKIVGLAWGDGPADSALVGPVQYLVGRLVQPVCRCGNATARGHGAVDGRRPYSCSEVLQIRARERRTAWWRWSR